MKQTIVYGDREWHLGSMTVDELETAGELAQAAWPLLAPSENPAHLIAILAVLLRRDLDEDGTVAALGRPTLAQVEMILHVEDTSEVT